VPLLDPEPEPVAAAKTENPFQVLAGFKPTTPE